MRVQSILFASACALLLTACSGGDDRAADAPASGWATRSGAAPLVIAHRGASGYLPEHTIEAYQRAIEMGAEVIEPDLVMSADGVLMARHDRYLSTTTNIADLPEFADRRRVEDGREDWWVEDFTREELRRLRARQPFPGRSAEFDDQFAVPDFDAVLDLAEAAGVRLEPEVKSPGRLAEIGLDPLPVLVARLRERGLDGANAPLAVQSFEAEFLRRLDAEVETPLLMLVFETDDGTPSVSFEDMAGFADGVGPQKTLLVDRAGTDTGYIAEAHARGLDVHPWTFRDDQAAPDGVDAETELRRIFALGADAVFTDFPDTALRVRAQMQSETGE